MTHSDSNLQGVQSINIYSFKKQFVVLSKVNLYVCVCVCVKYLSVQIPTPQMAHSLKDKVTEDNILFTVEEKKERKS